MHSMTMSKYPKIFLTIVSLLILIISFNAEAFIRRQFRLEEIVHACSNVVFGKVSVIDQGKMCFVVDELENIKGDGQFDQIKIRLAIGQGDCSKRLIAKLHTDLPIVLFYILQNPKRIESIGYVSGKWIRLFAIREDPKEFEWYFTYFEKYMGRTFDGDTSELQSSIREILTGKTTDEHDKGFRSMLKNLVNFVVGLFDGKEEKEQEG